MNVRVALLKPDLDGDRFKEAFDRQPVGLTHDLSQLDLFRFDRIQQLCRQHQDTP